ncbi:MAG: GNAT family N-acetyltransferase [Gammaproteobacteria bacterium]
MSIEIRPARPDDALVIARFNAALASESEARTLDMSRLQNGVEALLSDSGKGRYWLAEVDGHVAGQISVTYEWSDWRNAVFWWIQSVYVPPEHRSAGVFRALYAHVEELAQKDDSVCGIRLYVDHDNKRAQDIYRHVGLDVAGYEVMELDYRNRGKLDVEER